MTDDAAADLRIDVHGSSWTIGLVASAPADPGTRRMSIDVPPTASDLPPRRVTATVRYTTARNVGSAGWPVWHVKIYECDTVGDAEALRHHLIRQATAIAYANDRLPRPPGSARTSQTSIDPPWAVVPVHVVRGDGLQRGDESVRTELTAPAERVIDTVTRTLPAWFGDAASTPERYVVLLSPYLDQVAWAPPRASPATEQLVDFVDLAAGLDRLHQVGTVHCDINPDNVCRYTTGRASGYVLIDTDAVTQIDPLPHSVRTTTRYEHAGLRRWRISGARPELGPDPNLLRAHDRFGFALVVLAALAGRDWVEKVLLREDEDTGTRRVDSGEAVAEALRGLWVDTRSRRWASLIETLGEPFGPLIEDSSWSAARWIARLLEAERHAVPVPVPAAQPYVPVDRFTADLARIRADAHRLPTTRPERLLRAYAAVENAAHAVAVRAAIHASLHLAAPITSRSRSLRRRVVSVCGSGDQFATLGHLFADWVDEGPAAPRGVIARVEPAIAAYLMGAARVGRWWGTRALLIVLVIIVAFVPLWRIVR